jgi:hypothetical protein
VGNEGSRGMGEVEGEEEGVKERDEGQGMVEKAVERGARELSRYLVLVRALDWRTLGRTVGLGSCREHTGGERRVACVRNRRMTGAASARACVEQRRCVPSLRQRCGCGESVSKRRCMQKEERCQRRGGTAGKE